MRPLRVLVVDDNPQDRRLVIRELRKAYADAEIFEAINQVELDDHIRDQNFDVVVTDYHLQWSDGIRVLKSVKLTSPNCPVIMFTATGSEDIAVEAMKLGLDDYIIKNVKHLVRLRAAVNAAIDHAVTRSRVNRLAARLESLLSQLQVGVFTCRIDGSFLDLNTAMMRLLGCDLPADAYGKSLLNLLTSQEESNQFLDRVQNSNEAQEVEIVIDDSEQDRYYRLTARKVDGEGNEPLIDGLVEDITRRKKAEREAKRAAIAHGQLSTLSPREREVLEEVIKGIPNKAIAKHLDISEKTVEKHRSSLMKKLGLRSVAELVRLAMLAEAAG